MIDGMPYLIDYNTEEGILVIDRIRDDLQGVDEQRRMNYYSGMSSVEPMYLDGEPDHLWVFFYGAGPFVQDPNMQVWGCVLPSFEGGYVSQGSWKSGWIITRPFYMGRRTYLFSYNPPVMFGKATVAIDQLRYNGQGFDELWRGEWANDWTAIEPFYLDGRAYLVEYKAGDGTVAIDRLRENAQGTDEMWRGSGKWRVGWSLLRVFYHQRKPHVLVYNANTGGGDWIIYRVKDDLQGFDKVSDGTWMPPGIVKSVWFIIEPFYRQGKLYFVAHDYFRSLIPDPGDPVIAFGDPGEDLKTIKTIWSGKWRKGWSHIKPVYVPPTPFPPIIP